MRTTLKRGNNFYLRCIRRTPFLRLIFKVKNASYTPENTVFHKFNRPSPLSRGQHRSLSRKGPGFDLGSEQFPGWDFFRGFILIVRQMSGNLGHIRPRLSYGHYVSSKPCIILLWTATVSDHSCSTWPSLNNHQVQWSSSEGSSVSNSSNTSNRNSSSSNSSCSSKSESRNNSDHPAEAWLSRPCGNIKMSCATPQGHHKLVSFASVQLSVWLFREKISCTHVYLVWKVL